MAKSKSDISLGGAEQKMSREELAAVTKAVATLSPEDRDLLAAVQESPFRLTTAEQFLEFEKNVDCFVLEPHVQTLGVLHQPGVSVPHGRPMAARPPPGEAGGPQALHQGAAGTEQTGVQEQE